MNEQKPLFEIIYDAVRTIPEGMVASYGQIAAFVGRCSPLMVGYAMAALSFGSDVPWHRVVNHKGYISPRGDGDDAIRVQHALLESEGICFDDSGRIDMATYQWQFPDTDPI